MTDDRRFAHQQLNSVAYVLAEEIRDGNWDHVPDLKAKPVGDCLEIVGELERRCPGFAPEAYKRAIATGMFETR
ncbi:hypothetical protein E1B00_15430 [Arenimonas terrae]|uniref:Uncharacterized protein n=1 Tax=Arenimonas terrae TaxID=2546226 RepID=A0A5C4RMZ0_9GAMM|nr:hypothetical protein E1B00_15430 [Arenimonas terrae]